MTALAIDSMQGLLQKCAHNTVPSLPEVENICCIYGATSLYNDVTWVATTMECAKIEQIHGASVVVRASKDCARA